MNLALATNGVTNSTHHEVREFSILRLNHADVVWGVDKAVASDFFLELLRHVSAESIEEVVHSLLVLALHLHFVQLRHEDGVTEGVLAIKKLRSYRNGLWHLRYSL
jgi:hypothetical protein